MQIPAIEQAPPAVIEAYQVEALQQLLQYVSRHSAFYQAHFQRHNIQLDAIQSLADLAKIPTVSKKDLQSHHQQFCCVPRRAIIDYSNTSGTEGEAVTIPLTENDLERLTYNEQLSLACTGGSADEVYQLTTTADRRFMAGLAYILGARKLGAGMVRVGPGIPELQWKTIAEVQPTALIIVPSFLLKLIDYAESQGINYHSSSVRKAVCIGEPIRNDDLSLNALGRRIREKWDIALYSTYASTEMATAFTECEAGRGGHHHPELIITELLDDEGQPVAPGQTGELTITTLGVEAMPLIRFRTGDLCKKYAEPCSCGRTTYRLGPVLGRKNQMIKYKGTTLYPSSLFNVLDHTPQVLNYLVEVYANEWGNDEIRVYYVADAGLNQKALADHFKSSVRVTPALVPLEPEALHKMMYPQMSRKPVKFLDRRMLVKG